MLIDRCGKHFGVILNYLRDGSVPLPESKRELQELLIEAKYFLIQELLSACELALERWKDSKMVEPICSVPVSFRVLIVESPRL